MIIYVCVSVCACVKSGKFRNQTLTIWTAQQPEKKGKKRSEKRKSQKKEDEGAQKGTVEKSRNFVFPMFCSSGGSKSRLAKAAGAEPSGEMRDQK